VAQPLIRRFVEDLIAKVDLPDPVYEFGALQVKEDQDADLRPLFPGRQFVGTDFREGPGVDRVEDLRALTLGDGEVGTALCLDTLEHCEDPPQACRELARVTADGGVCVISSVMLFGIHAFPSDYFRFTPEGFRSLLRGFDDVWVCGVGHPSIPTQVIGVGAKRRKLELGLEDFPSLVDAQRTFDEGRGKVRVGVHNHRPSVLLKALWRDAPRLARERLGRGGRGSAGSL
jgi:SAM-dependent methyltransferase